MNTKRGGGTRLYWVSFDVLDEVPESELYALFARPLSELVARGMVDKEHLIQALLGDLTRHYSLPPEKVAEAERHILSTRASAVFGPKMIPELSRRLNLQVTPGGSPMRVWSRFIQHVELESRSGWKIRRGLFPSTLEAYYPSGTQIPSTDNARAVAQPAQAGR